MNTLWWSDHLIGTEETLKDMGIIDLYQPITKHNKVEIIFIVLDANYL